MFEKKLAIIPARGGSKRIPRKNIRDFLGKPIISYSIEIAQKTGLFDEIMVSTDDEEIAQIAIQYGAKVPFKRSVTNSSDSATTFDVINETLDSYKKIGCEFGYSCCIYATSPLIREEHLIDGYTKLKDQSLDSVIPIVPFGFPIWRGFEIVDGQRVIMLWPEYLNSRSQDLKKVYHDAGQWYWFNTSLRNRSNSLFNSNTGYILLSELEAQDIDNNIDWELAEMKFQILNSSK